MTARDSRSLLEVLEHHYGDLESRESLGDGVPLTRVILLLLARGSKVRQATQVLERLQAEYVDWNELRVTPTYELRKHLRTLEHAAPAVASSKAEPADSSKEGRIAAPEVRADKADQIRELLSTVFNRFNKLSLDFMREGSSEPDAPRKRAKFSQWLEDHQPAIELMLASYCGGKMDPATSSLVQRVIQRIGWTRGKTGAVATRAALLAHGEGLPPLALQWRFAQLAAHVCHARTPECGACPVAASCAVGRKTVKPVKAKAPAAVRKTAARVRK
ncbi:MAG: hypothetical protein EXS14_03235 [Planctomycetes bacterium]|nr:hypothetical protein [Planctomycetota bacterium]